MLYFTVGPSQIYPTVKKHMLDALTLDIPSMSHRGQKFKDLFQKTLLSLRTLMNIPPTHSIFFLASALEGMERSIQNCVEKESFHIITGAFGERFYKTSLELGKKAEKLDVLDCHPELEKIQWIFESGSSNSMVNNQPWKMPKQVRHDGYTGNLVIPPTSELICLTQNDTSTGFAIPMEQIYALKTKYPKKLIAIDVVSSVPYVDIDFSKIDITFFSVQKGFGLPAGLGVIIVSPQALKKAENLQKKGISIGSYHNFLSLKNSAGKWETPETPNVLNIYLFSKILEDFLAIGIDKIRQQTDQKASLIYTRFEAPPPGCIPETFIKNPEYYSKTTIVIDTKGQTPKILKKLSAKGFVVGAGYGKNADTHIRIANFPAHKINDLKKLLKTITA